MVQYGIHAGNSRDGGQNGRLIEPHNRLRVVVSPSVCQFAMFHLAKLSHPSRLIRLCKLKRCCTVMRTSYGTSCLSTFSMIRLEETHGFPVLMLNRPPVNAFNKQFLVETQQALEYLEKNSSTGFILASTLPATFSAGIDFSEIYQREKRDVEAFWREMQMMWLMLYSYPRPIVAAINGHCLAGGCVLVSCADYRLAAAGVYDFCIPAARLGLTAPLWFLKALRSIVGQRCTELIVSRAENMQPERALNIGLVDELCEPRVLLERSVEVLKSFSKIDQETQTRMKLMLRQDLLQSVDMDSDRDQFVEWTCREKTQNILATVNAKLKKQTTT